MKTFHAFSACIVAILTIAGCSKPKPTPTLALNDAASIAYAKAACTRNKVACQGDPMQAVRSFEDNLATSMASNLRCLQIQFVRSEHNADETTKRALNTPHWTLQLDFVPGHSQQAWSLTAPGSNTNIHGEGNPAASAQQICTMIDKAGSAATN